MVPVLQTLIIHSVFLKPFVQGKPLGEAFGVSVEVCHRLPCRFCGMYAVEDDMLGWVFAHRVICSATGIRATPFVRFGETERGSIFEEATEGLGEIEHGDVGSLSVERVHFRLQLRVV